MILDISRMNKIFRLLGVLTFVLIANFSCYAAESTADKPTEEVAKSQSVTKIVVQGNQRIESSTITSYLPFKVGGNFTQARSDKALKTLYGTGLFSEVSVSFNKGVVSIKVKENPIISKIIFEGNSAIKTEYLENELILRPRMVYSKSRIRDDTNKIIEIYNKIGRFATTVTPKIVKLPQNRINLVFDIHEGKKAKIEKIFFVGNSHFSDRKLKEVIMSKEHRFWNLFAKTDHYDSDLVENDKVLLARFYNSHGYANFKVISATADIEPSKNVFYLTFSIDEGHKYKFGNIDLTSNIKNINLSTLKNLIQTKKGTTFNVSLVDDSIESITKELANEGFPFVQIMPAYKIDDQTKTIDLTYEIGKARRTYIGRINIRGNLKTYDYVIRREVKVSEGDPYNAFLIDRSKKKLEDLDYFRKVTIDSKRTNKDDVVDLDVKVEEKSTAQIKFSGGYSTSDGIIGMISFSESNFLGRGQYIDAGIQKSANSFGTNFAFTEPRFLGNDMSAGFNIFKSSHNNKNSSWGATSNSLPYNTEALGLGLHIGYDVIDYLYHGVYYGVEKKKISGIEPDAPIYISQQAGSYLSSAIGQRFIYDKADSSTLPTKGYILKLDQTLAGIGGNTKYFRNIVGGSKYFPIAEDVTFKLDGQLAGILGYSGETVRINDRFYLGDQGFRGFQAAGIGPRDKSSGDALGGQYYYKGTTEITFPLGLPKELEVSGTAFSDFGSLWGVNIPNGINYPRSNFYDSKALRVSGGFGILWITRMGPLRFDIAKAIKKQSYDKTQMVHFSFETRF